MLTVERLRELLDYDPDTGIFRWRVSKKGKIKAGVIAGTVTEYGYVKISVDGKRYLAHRLAWFYIHGKWPTDQIDHVDMSRDNNRISNLREASQTMNLFNTRVHKNSTTGVKGVFPHRSKYQAKIGFNGRLVYLGTFEDVQEASEVYAKAATQYAGRFARTS